MLLKPCLAANDAIKVNSSDGNDGRWWSGHPLSIEGKFHRCKFASNEDNDARYSCCKAAGFVKNEMRARLRLAQAFQLALYLLVATIGAHQRVHYGFSQPALSTRSHLVLRSLQQVSVT